MTSGTTTLQTQIVATSAPGWSVPLSFDQFDPSLGTLSGVDVGLVGSVTGSAAIENLGATAASLQISLPSTIDVAAPDGTVLASVNPVATTTLNLAAYDGTTNFAGTSGTVVSRFSGTASVVSSDVPGPGDGVPFVGTGSIDLTASSQASSSITAGGNLLSLTEGQTGATVSVQYGYAPGSSGSTAGSGESSYIWDDFGVTPQPADLQTTSVQTLRIADATTGWNEAVAASQFNPALGTLEAINLTFVADANAGLAVENLGSTPGSISLAETADVTLALPGGLGTVANTPSINASTYLAAFDGTIDFAGQSGANLTELTASQITTSTYTGDNGDLSAFVGTGTIGLPISAISPSTLTGPADLAAELLTEAGATVEISYSYIPATTSSTVAAGAGPTISGTQAGQGVTDQTTVAPFANVRITAAGATSTETVTITQSAAANGTLTDLGGGRYDATTGVYSVTGSAAAVTAALDGLVFVPNANAVAPGQAVTTGFTITDADSAGVTATDTATSVVATTGVYIDTAAVAAEITAQLDQPAVPPTTGGTVSGQTSSGSDAAQAWQNVVITRESIALPPAGPSSFMYGGPATGGFGAGSGTNGAWGTIGSHAGFGGNATIPGITAGDFTFGLNGTQGVAGGIGAGGSFAGSNNPLSAFPIMSDYADTQLAKVLLTVPS